eukprot:CAMPEP_0118962722 /NCGR_PEP_ID=MMETSP1173-20130426/948_1 /TAXON_ID=1034831 /ORGANISM="Rhizochromulina marina cf, Strain CCMP1243" /LENGTH=66 /DNA_ID=CAMNT_0006911013 /DNA_START=560 /DNA_END=756 /DNA_ORIENTATION=-
MVLAGADPAPSLEDGVAALAHKRCNFSRWLGRQGDDHRMVQRHCDVSALGAPPPPPQAQSHKHQTT